MQLMKQLMQVSRNETTITLVSVTILEDEDFLSCELHLNLNTNREKEDNSSGIVSVNGDVWVEIGAEENETNEDLLQRAANALFS